MADSSAVAAPSILITTTGGRHADRGVFAAWPDGVIAWSDDVVNGGGPYQIARVDAAAVSRGVQEIAHGGEWLAERRFGPDARWTHLLVDLGGQAVVDVGSWHELAELNPNLVVTAAGIEPLAGRSRTAVLAAQPSSYREFRERWARVKTRALSLIQEAQRPAAPQDRARIAWPDSGNTP